MKSRGLLGTALAMALTPVAFLGDAVRLTPQPGVARTDRWRRHKPGRSSWAPSGKFYLPNGERECARRRRQIAAGILRRENGLRVSVDEGFI